MSKNETKMEEAFKIYVDQLRKGQVTQIDETVGTDFIDLKDEDIHFDKELNMKGEAYLADDELIINLNVTTTAFIPCAICNSPVKVPMNLENLYMTVAPEEYTSGIFFFNELLRESILLEVPRFAECNGGKCPKRKEIGTYLRNPEEENGYKPFADLDFDEKAEKEE